MNKGKRVVNKRFVYDQNTNRPAGVIEETTEE